MIAKQHVYKNEVGAVQKQKELSKKLGYTPNVLRVTNRQTKEVVYKVIEPQMSPDFSTVRKEAQDWVSGMGGAVTDKDVSKRIGKASKKDVKGFVGDMKKSLLWKWY